MDLIKNFNLIFQKQNLETPELDNRKKGVS